MESSAESWGQNCTYIKVQARVCIGIGAGGTDVVGSGLALSRVAGTVVLLCIVEEVLTVGQSLAVGCFVVSRMGIWGTGVNCACLDGIFAI